MGLLDLLFPKFCVSCKTSGSYLCANCFSFLSFSKQSTCVVCNKASINELTHPGCMKKYTIDGAFASIAYKGVAKKLIYNFKYKPYLSDLKTVLVDLFYEGLIQKESFYQAITTFVILTPIPLSKSKDKGRGYNQAAILASGLGQKFNIPMIELLERVKETQSQVGLDPKERRNNIAGAFAVKKGHEQTIKNATILIIDDVLTTGATVSEAANILKRSGAKKVFGAILAKD